MALSRIWRRMRHRWRAGRSRIRPLSAARAPHAPGPSGRGWWNLVFLYLTFALLTGGVVAFLAAAGRPSIRPEGRTLLRQAAGYVAHRLIPATVFLFEAEGGLPRETLESGLPMLRAVVMAKRTGREQGWPNRLLVALTGVDLYDPRSMVRTQMPVAWGPQVSEEKETEVSPEPTQPTASVSGGGGVSGGAATPGKTPGLDAGVPPDGASGPIIRQSANVEKLRTVNWGTRPLVAVYHTHSSEAYHGPTGHGSRSGYSEADYAWGQTSGLIAVGDELVRILSDEYRIPVVHSRNIHDYPVFRNAYTNSAATARSILARYPTVTLLVDLHRDGIAGPTDSNITAVMAGERLARISLIVGQGQPEFPNPHWEKNQALAQAVHARIEQMYPGLSRGVTVRKWPYNQELSEGALLLEIGDHNNTRAEALRSAALLGDVIADLLKERVDAATTSGDGT